MPLSRWYSSVILGLSRLGLRRSRRLAPRTPEAVDALLNVTDSLSGSAPQGFLVQGVPIWPNLRGVTHTRLDDVKMPTGGTAIVFNIEGETPDGREQIFDFYRDQLTQGGWQAGDVTPVSPGLFSLEFKQGGRAVLVSTSQNVLPPMTTLFLTVWVSSQEVVSQAPEL